MSPSPLWSLRDDNEQEWPKLDLLEHHLTRLALSWTVPYAEEEVVEFGDLLSDEDGFISVMSYSRHRVKHHRIESAQPALDESNDLVVSVHHETGTPLLSQIPKELEEPAYLLESPLAFRLETPIAVVAQFGFLAGKFASVVPLPLDLPPPVDHPTAFDRFVGILGVREAAAGDVASGHAFTLDRAATGALNLTIDSNLPPGPVEKAPELALATAVERPGWLVRARR